jgi:hypothetical protein
MSSRREFVIKDHSRATRVKTGAARPRNYHNLQRLPNRQSPPSRLPSRKIAPWQLVPLPRASRAARLFALRYQAGHAQVALASSIDESSLDENQIKNKMVIAYPAFRSYDNPRKALTKLAAVFVLSSGQ